MFWLRQRGTVTATSSHQSRTNSNNVKTARTATAQPIRAPMTATPHHQCHQSTSTTSINSTTQQLYHQNANNTYLPHQRNSENESNSPFQSKSYNSNSNSNSINDKATIACGVHILVQKATMYRLWCGYPCRKR